MKFTCASCLQEFLAPNRSPFLYGEFLLRSSTNDIRFFLATDDRVLDEVESIIAEIQMKDFAADVKCATAHHAIFGEVACDPDSAGNPFKTNVLPQCPDCGTHEMAEWDIADPSRTIDVPVEPVTHHRWDSLTMDEKLLSVREALGKWITVSRSM